MTTFPQALNNPAPELDWLSLTVLLKRNNVPVEPLRIPPPSLVALLQQTR
jgi:hypothetical protein